MSAAALLVACSANARGPDSPRASAIAVPRGQVVVLRSDGELVRLTARGRRAGSFGTIPGTPAWVDSISIAPDRRSVLVSSVRALSEQPCVAVTYEVRSDRRPRKIIDGGSVAFSPDGRHLAYFRYDDAGGSCRRNRLVIRDRRSGHESERPIPGGPSLHGNPHEHAVNWSPDSRYLVYRANGPLVVADIRRGTNRLVGPGGPRGPTGWSAPAFMTASLLIVNDNCCQGDQHLVAAPIAGGRTRPLFSVPYAVRSIRPDGARGFWLTTEYQKLYHWDGSRLLTVASDASVVGA